MREEETFDELNIVAASTFIRFFELVPKKTLICAGSNTIRENSRI